MRAEGVVAYFHDGSAPDLPAVVNHYDRLFRLGLTPSDKGDLVEYCLRPSPLMRNLVRNLPPLRDGRVPVPQGPGLGIELDEDVIARYRV